jgi:hypothetical protein
LTLGGFEELAGVSGVIEFGFVANKNQRTHADQEKPTSALPRRRA